MVTIVFKTKIRRRTCIAAALTAAMMVWLPNLFSPSVAAASGDLDHDFDKLGIVNIHHLAPPVDFVLKDLSGRRVRLSDFKGKVVFLSFWTTWCPQCRFEMPALEKLNRRFKDRAFIMLAVSLGEPKSSVSQFVKRQRLTFRALLDADGRVGRRFGIRSIPTTIIIDRYGSMIGKAIGSRPWDSPTAASLIEHLIGNPPDRRVSYEKQPQ
jgi:peroxiredoxin